jgi:bifunctional DNA-binding transcriptional regulator/antitoxin component of YhaV-PrlF toxin-antitoxin module
MNKMYRILGKRGRITIPYEIRQRVGFAYNDVLSFTEAPDGCTVMVKREKMERSLRLERMRLRSLTF